MSLGIQFRASLIYMLIQEEEANYMLQADPTRQKRRTLSEPIA
jgi:hypothetical protein